MPDPSAEKSKPSDSEVFTLGFENPERRQSFQALFFDTRHDWRSPYALMVLLSAGIATLGLSQNSAAVIIGAMIIAPLGQPIIAFGEAIVLGWKWEILRLMGTILAGAVGQSRSATC